MSRLWSLAVLAASGPAVPADAGEIEHADIDYRGGRYTIDMAIRLDARPDRVLEVVRDPDRLARISDAIIDVEILERPDPARYLRKVHIEKCVLMFCFDKVMVEWVEDRPGGEILTTLIPERSDFDFGESRWTVAGIDGGATRVTLTSEREPSFWVPPVIGPWMLTRTLTRETRTALERIASMARAMAGADAAGPE